jgi:hypothetical protein
MEAFQCDCCGKLRKGRSHYLDTEIPGIAFASLRKHWNWPSGEMQHYKFELCMTCSDEFGAVIYDLFKSIQARNKAITNA